MLYKDDFSLLDGDTSSVKFEHNPVKAFYNLNWNWNGNASEGILEMKWWHNIFSVHIPAYGARSFIIKQDALSEKNKCKKR